MQMTTERPSAAITKNMLSAVCRLLYFASRIQCSLAKGHVQRSCSPNLQLIGLRVAHFKNQNSAKIHNANDLCKVAARFVFRYFVDECLVVRVYS